MWANELMGMGRKTGESRGGNADLAEGERLNLLWGSVPDEVGPPGAHQLGEEVHVQPSPQSHLHGTRAAPPQPL